jgi:glycosyltransferase involved in cell wall biosynthesis
MHRTGSSLPAEDRRLVREPPLNVHLSPAFPLRLRRAINKFERFTKNGNPSLEACSIIFSDVRILPSCYGAKQTVRNLLGRMARRSSLLAMPDRLISIILPVYNEAENLSALLPALSETLDTLGLHYEIVVVDDGSTDETASTHRGLPRLRVVRLRRNSGQTAALMAGIRFARGEVLISMDGDLQNDPADIAQILAKLDEGFDVVSGWRMNRQDARIRRNLLSRVANKLISIVSGVHLHDYGCSLKAYRRSALEGVHLYGEMHRFIPIYAYWNGARVAEVPVKHHARRFGVSKYGLERIPKVILDLLVVVFLHRFGQRPMYVFGSVGLLSIGIGVFAGAAAVYYKFFGSKSFIETPLPLLFVMAMITGAMCFLMGLLAELLVRTYYESQKKTTYAVSTVTGTETNAASSAPDVPDTAAHRS